MINLYIFDIKTSRSSVFGIGTYINQLETSLKHVNFHVCFVHLNSNTQRFSQEAEDGVFHWYIPFPKNKYKDEEKHNNFYLQNVIFIIRQYIQPTENLVFHINFFKCQTFVDALKQSFNCSIVISVHFFSWCFDIFGNVSRLQKTICKSDTQLDQLGKTIKKSFNDEKELFFSVDQVLCLSKHTSTILQKIYQVKKQRISVIYNGLKDKLEIKPDKDLIRRKYHLPVEMPVIIFAGRLDPVKGLSYFIQASKIVIDHFPNCHVVIAGSGDYDACMKECGNRWMNIHFTGMLGKTELYELYSIADFGVMPSFHEQCSYVAIEMMMYGLPIIGSTSTGLKEMIIDGETGLHFPVIEYDDRVEIDSSILSEKMLYLLQNKHVRQRIGINARQRYEQLYSLEVMRKNMLQFYTSL